MIGSIASGFGSIDFGGGGGGGGFAGNASTSNYSFTPMSA